MYQILRNAFCMENSLKCCCKLKGHGLQLEIHVFLVLSALFFYVAMNTYSYFQLFFSSRP
jgi:hypothetical protein